MVRVKYRTKSGHELEVEAQDGMKELTVHEQEVSDEEFIEIKSKIEAGESPISIGTASAKEASCREDIDEAMACGCGTPGCKNKAEWLHQRCHPGAGISVRYENGIMELYCHECRKPVMAVHIASREKIECGNCPMRDLDSDAMRN